MKTLWLCGGLFLAACASTGEDEGSHIADVRFVDINGQPAGEATLFRVADGVRIVANLPGLPAREHGFHIHSVGECRAPTFESAGPHFNPTGKQHGRLNPAGAHLGDLPNIERPMFIIVARDVPLTGPQGLFDVNGSSLVVHQQADDLRTDPSGNSGLRIRCGVIAAR